jgi:hypothetical protein
MVIALIIKINYEVNFHRPRKDFTQMKKLLLPTLLIAVLTLALAGMASAQAPNPPQPESPEGYYGRGMMGGWSGRGSGMWGRGLRPGEAADTGDYGPMHDQMIETFAQAFDLSVEELEERLIAGESMWNIAEGSGLSFEQFRDLMLEARNKALSQAVTDGLISQEHFQWMQSRMSQMWSGEYQPGFASCHGGGQRGFGMYGSGMYRYNTR